MHAVMRGRVHHPLERAEPIDGLGMDPELIEQVDGLHRDVPDRRKADQGQRQVKDPGEATLESALPQGDRQVVFLALMMHDVRGPRGGILVRDAMEPVKAEIDAEHEPDRRDPFHRGRRVGDFQQAKMFEEVQVTGEQQHVQEDRHDLIDHAATDIGDRIVETVQPLALDLTGDDLDQDQQKEKTAPPDRRN